MTQLSGAQSLRAAPGREGPAFINGFYVPPPPVGPVLTIHIWGKKFLKFGICMRNQQILANYILMLHILFILGVTSSK